MFTNVFGGNLIQPSDLTYQELFLTDDIVTFWPTETEENRTLVAQITDVWANVSGKTLTLPDATKGSNGSTILFSNLGTFSFQVLDSTGSAVVTVAAGEAWFVYLKDNSTVAGSWRAIQYASFVSQANAAALAGVGLTSTANQLVPNTPVNTFNSSRSSSNSDRAQLFVWTGNAGNFTLPDPVAVGSGWYVQLKNIGTGSLTVLPGGSSTIDGEASRPMNVGDSGFFVSDGLTFYVIGFGQDAVFAFDNVSIDVSGTGAYTLTGSQLNRISYNFTGVLTGNREIVVPTTIQQYWVRNSTTGSFTLTVKTLGQPGTGVTQGGANILFCDGIDVRSANTGGIATPIAIADGGTGATTPSAARTNLGAGATGDSLFTSATPAVAYAVLGRPPAGVIDGGVF